MGILVMQRLGDGSLASVDSDVLDIARRIQEGDGTLGWEGSKDLSLKYDHKRREFVVVCEPVGLEPYIVCRHARCDAELLRKVVMADGRHRDVFAEVERANAAWEREQDRRYDDWLDNHIIPKSRWALRRDEGWDTRGQYVGFGGS